MSSVLVLLTSITCALSFPAVPTYDLQNAAFAHYNTLQQYSLALKERDLLSGASSVVNEPNKQPVSIRSVTSNAGSIIIPNYLRTYRERVGTHQGFNTGPSNYNEPLFRASSVANEPNRQSAFIQGGRSNAGDSGSIRVGTHQGFNSGPSNYNEPLFRASSVVNEPNRQSAFIQGGRSNAGDSGSIRVGTHQGNTGPGNYNEPLFRTSSVVNEPKRHSVFIQGARDEGGDSGSIYVPGN